MLLGRGPGACRAPIVLAVMVALLLATTSFAEAGAAPAPSASPAVPGTSAVGADPRSTRFTGTITSGTGAYAVAKGAVVLDLTAWAATRNRMDRPFTLRVGGSLCPTPGLGPCWLLTGTVVGTLIQHVRNPDLGRVWTLSAGPALVRPLGVVQTTGTLTGTGFIVHGVPRLQVTLAAAGSVTFTATGPSEPPFWEP